MEAKYLSRSSLYKGEYDCQFRNPNNEMKSGLHYHDFYEIVIYLGKAGIFKINNEEYIIERGDIVLINMFDPHTLIYNKHAYYERFSISIDPNLLLSFNTAASNLLDIFTSSNKHYPIFHVKGKCLDKYVNLVKHYIEDKPAHGKDMFETAILHQIASYLYSDCFDGIYNDSTASKHISLVATLVEYINKHLAGDLSLETLAKQVNYSEYYICRVFKQVTNNTLNNYIVEKRIAQVIHYLGNEVPISKAAELSGFNNYSYFYKVFKKHLGISPADYKKAHSVLPMT